MIHGIGTDICSVDRIRELSKKYGESFLTKFLSKEEIKSISNKDSHPHIAGRFAAKESILKAIGNVRIPFNLPIVLNDENGKPYISNSCEVITAGKLPETSQIHITISHEKEFAVAFVTIEY